MQQQKQTAYVQNEHWREIYADIGREALGRLDALLRRGTGYFVGNDVILSYIHIPHLYLIITLYFSDHLGRYHRLRTLI